MTVGWEHFGVGCYIWWGWTWTTCGMYPDPVGTQIICDPEAKFAILPLLGYELKYRYYTDKYRLILFIYVFILTVNKLILGKLGVFQGQEHSKVHF